MDVDPVEPTARTPWPRTAAVAAAVAVSAFALTLVAVALPLFGFARMVEPNRGVARPWIRSGLVTFAVPVSSLVALLAGGLAARWYRRGGRLPTS